MCRTGFSVHLPQGLKDAEAAMQLHNLDVQGAGGSFILNGEKQSLPYKADANTSSRPGKIHIVGGSATISLTVFE